MDSISSVMKLLRGPAFWLVVIWTMWTGYQIGKEAKTNWFSQNSQQESSLTINQSVKNSSEQIDLKMSR